jgi:hypothetical protein
MGTLSNETDFGEGTAYLYNFWTVASGALSTKLSESGHYWLHFQETTGKV